MSDRHPSNSIHEARDPVDNGVAGGQSEAALRLSAVLAISQVLVSDGNPNHVAGSVLGTLVKLIDAADAGIVLLADDSDGTLTVKASLGYDPEPLGHIRLTASESISGKVFTAGQPILFATPDQVARGMQNMRSENRAWLKTASQGTEQPYSAVGVPMLVGGRKVGVLYLASLHCARQFRSADLPFLQSVADVYASAVENQKLREQLELSRALGEANRLKAEVISTLAHELRTPLTSIKGYSSALVMEEASFSAETQREFLQFIDEECDTLQRLIRDLLESSIIDAGYLKLAPQPVRVDRVAQAVIRDLQHRNSSHRLVVDFPERFPLVDADPERIVQVLRNLLENAVNYSPNGSLVVLRGEVLAGEIKISVADQGMGIAPEHLNRLFERFFRAPSGLGRHVVGTGLGLPIAHAIVESHGGRIWAESHLGQGSTFFFTLPLPHLDSDEGDGIRD